MERQPAVYIMASKRNGTLYTGVTSNLIKRVYQHKHPGSVKSFTNKYQCKILVYYEQFSGMENAILREKQIKGGSRKDKIALIEDKNPEWDDLYKNII